VSREIGFALCGSYCTLARTIAVIERMVQAGWKITPIFSENMANRDTRFGKAQDFIDQIEDICGKKGLITLEDVEPIGPKKWFDALVIAPCTGSTLARLACGLSDTPQTLAAKSQLRVERPVVLAVSTNDALSGSAENIGKLLNRKQYYFVPMRQDAPQTKPRSMVAILENIPETVDAAIGGRQIQPIIL
jgi:dipicolinate synthase subunit B